MFKQELDYFISHQDELVRQFRGRTLVLKGAQVIGAYGSPLEAFVEAQKEHPLGTFMIQLCEPGPEAYTVTVSSLGIIS